MLGRRGEERRTILLCVPQAKTRLMQKVTLVLRDDDFYHSLQNDPKVEAIKKEGVESWNS